MLFLIADMIKFKKIIKKILISIFESFHIWQSQRDKIKTLRQLHNKRVIRCVFLCLYEEEWKYDKLYKLMCDHPRLDPLILIAPVVNYGYDDMLSRMRQCYEHLKNKGYSVIKLYDEVTESYVDLIKEIHPDVVFYTTPYKGQMDDRYFITSLKGVLTAYIPYYYNEGVAYRIAYDTLFQNMVWRRYVETEFHKELSKNNSRNKGINSVVTGYPGIEPLISSNDILTDSSWKIKDRRIKRIIWAPHHTLEAVNTCHYSCFLNYCDFMIEMAEKFQDSAQFVFKPHPLLRNKLNLLWGKKRTDDYYYKWESMRNTALKDGEYSDLFLTSDAMIHDSGSFLIEYLYVNKPVMRTLNDIPLKNMYNPFALKCLDNYYLGRNKQDIEVFIQNIIHNIDPLKEQRTKFVNEVLMPKGSPSQNIIDDILDSIDNQILYRN